ncbi:MAG: phage holin family protein [bacterium]|nr:phage holin family protein [bacterium]
MKLLFRWLLVACTLMLVTYYVPGIFVRDIWVALIAALVLGLVNTLIRPVLLILTLPINILTVGLFTLVINALMFWLASAFVSGFFVAGFVPAFWGALIVSVVSWFVNSLLSNRRV